MAAIDYGALLRVNGEFANKNTNLFMNASNTGYVLDKARYEDISIYDKDIDINGYFYVYAGDKDLLLTFYKGFFYVILDGLILTAVSNLPFISETFNINGVQIKVSHLEPELQIDEGEDIGTWKDHVREHWKGATGDEKLSQLENGSKWYKIFVKRLKRKASGWNVYKDRTQRWIAEWGYNGDKYEVIFGYGIDPNEDVWNDIKNDSYGFTEREIKIIDEWFTE